MNRIDLAVSGAELLLQPDFRPGCPQNGEPSEELFFKSVLAGECRKAVSGLKPQEEPVLTVPDSGEPVPEQNEEPAEPVPLFPVNPEEPPVFEDEQRSDPGCVMPLLAAECVDEPVLLPGSLSETALSPGTRPLPADQLAFNDQRRPLIFPEPALRDGDGPAEAGLGAGLFEPEVESAGQVGIRPVLNQALIQEAASPKSALFLERTAGRAPSDTRFTASGGLEEQNLPRADLELNWGEEDTAELLYGSVKIKGADIRIASAVQERLENQELLITMAPASPELKQPAEPAGQERFLPPQISGENLPANEGTFTLPETGRGLESRWPSLTEGVLDQLTGYCAYFRERGEAPAEIRLALNPPQLGELLIRVFSRQGKLSAKIIAEVAVVKEMLVHNLPELHQRFEQNNLHLDRIDLLTAEEMFQEDHRFKKGDYRELWVNEGGPKPVVQEESEPRLKWLSGPADDGAINYWA
ncbi:MAG: flagellar hook-length control protein FliK [Dethiobacteria bacterium]